ncbi:MAG: universal stress protein [Cyclobacteriaceae bacterium]|nr:universal stress protein [Cyclobacteriaceae bacterium]
MKDTILCAIDFSDASMNALKRAIQLAVCTNAHLSVLFSYRLIHTGQQDSVMVFKKKMEDEAIEKFKEIEKKLINGQDVSRGFITEIGFMSDNIERFVRKNPISMLVLSRSMCSNLNDHKGISLEEFIGSINVPLLIVPN